MGISFLFVPIPSAAYIGIPQDKTNEASALINVMRNLGGSFGISLSQTALAEWSQRHETHLIEHLTLYDHAYRKALSRLAEQVGATPGTAKAFAALMREVQRQAAMQSYIDILMCWDGLPDL